MRKPEIVLVPTEAGEVVFRKPLHSVLVFLSLFLLISCVSIYGRQLEVGTLSFASFLLALASLATAVRQWRYRVRLSAEALTVSAFVSRTVLLRDVSDATVGSFRGTTFLRIGLKTGEGDLTVGADLAGFPAFEQQLLDQLKRSRA